VTFILITASLINPQEKKDTANKEIQLIMRADDIGFSNAANIATIKGYREGIITSTEVLIPGPWFIAAVKLLRENPGLDAGVHLALTSEWENYKWGPVSNAPTLVTADGYFPASNEELKSMKINLKEAENELRAQIELAKKYIPQISHLSNHMGTVTCTPELRQITERLSKEYNLPIEDDGPVYFLSPWGEPLEQKENYLVNSLNNLQPGVKIMVCHLSVNNEESAAIKSLDMNDANQRMALHRQTELNMVTGDKLKEIIKERNIKLRDFPGKFKDISK
jgi:predicted glycoside hydrolase/deacetylase ChbG (UPF0249 family)